MRILANSLWDTGKALPHGRFAALSVERETPRWCRHLDNNDQRELALFRWSECPADTASSTHPSEGDSTLEEDWQPLAPESMSSAITDQEYPRGPQEKMCSFILQKELKINGREDNGSLEAGSNHFLVSLRFGVNWKTASQQGECLRGHIQKVWLSEDRTR